MPANQNSACVDLNLDSAQDACSHIHNTVSHHLSTTSSQDTVPHLSAYACDVTSEDLVQQTFSSIIHDFGGIDVLVTAAGIVDNVAAEEYGFERWKMMLDVNLNGTFLCAREAGRHMLREGKGGSIVLVGSMSAFICVRPQKQAAYNTSKAGVSILTKSLATEWGPHGIRVNCLNPGYLKTDLIAGLLERDGRGLDKEWVKDVPLGRMGHPSEMGGAAVWMASDASSYLTGSDIVVDGGYTCY
ncbi:MAG: hypothetical protein M1813_007555 [Trichoglossum hirsutum]|nr:MAG: hypothetical protein M1813_007555 [Trichoglossum hirsutum]